MNIATTIRIINFFFILGIILLVVVMLVNWIKSWEVQYLFWIPMITWMISLIFAFVSAIKLPGGLIYVCNKRES